MAIAKTLTETGIAAAHVHVRTRLKCSPSAPGGRAAEAWRGGGHHPRQRHERLAGASAEARDRVEAHGLLRERRRWGDVPASADRRASRHPVHRARRHADGGEEPPGAGSFNVYNSSYLANLLVERGALGGRPSPDSDAHRRRRLDAGDQLDYLGGVADPDHSRSRGDVAGRQQSRAERAQRDERKGARRLFRGDERLRAAARDEAILADVQHTRD